MATRKTKTATRATEKVTTRKKRPEPEVVIPSVVIPLAEIPKTRMVFNFDATLGKFEEEKFIASPKAIEMLPELKEGKVLILFSDVASKEQLEQAIKDAGWEGIFDEVYSKEPAKAVEGVAQVWGNDHLIAHS